MSDNELKTKVIEGLSKELPNELILALINSYEIVLAEYRKGHWDETLWKAGKFCENVFRILVFLINSKIETEAPNFKDTKEKLEKMPSDRLPESMRILVPRIATALIYDPRSKKSAVHVKEVNPDYLDASLVVTGCSWVLAELIRTYYKDETHKVSEIVNGLIQRKIPFIEFHGGRPYVTKPLDCKKEILLLLLNSPEGLTRRDIGNYLGQYYSAPRITNAISELEKQRYILKVDERYVISGPGEEEITKTLITLL